MSAYARPRGSAARGRLRIYLGYAPGTGTTCALLSEGRRRAEHGTDVVVASAETHGRPHTEDLLAGLEVMASAKVPYRGTLGEEMDLGAVLARGPAVALVDDFAHRNAPGSRHRARWQDVEDLLAAGIDVISTVSVGHLDSLADVVAKITGAAPGQSVPDSVVRAAGEVELVDVAPEALRDRLARGQIYPAGTGRHPPHLAGRAASRSQHQIAGHPPRRRTRRAHRHLHTYRQGRPGHDLVGNARSCYSHISRDIPPSADRRFRARAGQARPRRNHLNGTTPPHPVRTEAGVQGTITP